MKLLSINYIPGCEIEPFGDGKRNDCTNEEILDVFYGRHENSCGW